MLRRVTAARPLAALVLALIAASAAGLDICNERGCKCDGMSRVTCECRRAGEELVIRPEGPYGMLSTATQLDVYNCSRVYIKTNSFNNLRELIRVRFVNIPDLIVYGNSFNWYPDYKYVTDIQSGLQIVVENCTMVELPSYLIKGRIDKVSLKGVNIHWMKPYSFSSITNMKDIEITDSIIHNVEIQVFKKFSVDNFVLKNNTFPELPSRLLSDINISNSLTLDGNRIKIVKSNSLLVRVTRKVSIVNNVIDLMEGEPFQMIVSGNVIIGNNIMKELQSRVFSSIQVLKEVRDRGKKNLKFFNNTISYYKYDSLIMDVESFDLTLDKIYINHTCVCAELNLFRDADMNDQIYCLEDNNYKNLNEYKYIKCSSGGLGTVVIAVITTTTIIVILAIAAIITFIFIKYCKKRKVEASATNKTSDVIRPDGKTYKETELYVILEKAELLTTNL